MSLCWQLILAALAVLIVFKSRLSMNYHVKFILAYSWVIGMCGVLLPYLAHRPRDVANLLTCANAMRFSSKICGLKITLRGAEHLSQDKTCIFVANHQSGLDLIGLFEIWPIIKRMTAIAKRELMYVGTFGLACWLSGVTFIDRKAGSTARQAMNEAVVKLKEQRIKLWVFPEGTRRNTGEIHQFKKGAFHAAIYAQVPIVPVVYSSYKYFLDGKTKRFDDAEIIVTALPEISTEGLKSEDVDSLIERTRTVMIEAFNAATREVEKASKA